MHKVTIYTDGGSSGNPGAAGWGAILISGDNRKEMKGSLDNATNNQAELTGAIEALRALKFSCEVELISDSTYLINTMTKGWKRKANLDLWAQLDAAAEPHTMTWTWVRGHDGNEQNERAHELAQEAIETVKSRQN